MSDFIIEEEKNTIKITRGNFGVVYIIENNKIDLNHSLAFEASDKGRCICFENLENMNIKKFDKRLKKVLKERGIFILSRKRGSGKPL